MQLLLGEGEQVLKSWDYAKQKKLIGFKRSYSLTLTNKRLIQTETLKRGVKRKDFLVENIRGVEVSNDSVLNILLIILGIIFLGGGIGMMVSLPVVGIAIGIALIIAAILLFIFSLSKSSISVAVYTETVPTAIAGAVATGFKGRGKAVKLKVNREASEDLASTLAKHILIDLHK